MERTDKVKIALAVLIAALLARVILGFFPTPLAFAPYTASGEGGVLEETTVTDLRLCFSAVSVDGTVGYYYLIHTEDGVSGFLKSSEKYISESLEPLPPEGTEKDPAKHYYYHATGISVILPNSSSGTVTEQASFWEIITFENDYLTEHNGDVVSAFAPFCSAVALDMSYTDTTENNPACFWVSLVCLAAFIWMLVLLLAEYFSGRRMKKKSGDEPEE